MAELLYCFSDRAWINEVRHLCGNPYLRRMKYHLLLLLLCASSLIFSQEATIKTDKELYNYNDLIEVTTEINARCDSFNLPDEYPGFRRVGDITKTSMLVYEKEGEDLYSLKHEFQLVAEEKGRLKIAGPIYFIGGQQYQADKITVEILNED